MDASDSTIPAPSLDELQPLFPTYKLEGLVAQGGMGAIYKAHQRSLDRPVAIKILAREVGEDETFRETFAAVSERFSENFPRLFGGGKASLQLTETEDVLEAGVEIMAMPPGDMSIT